MKINYPLYFTNNVYFIKSVFTKKKIILNKSVLPSIVFGSYSSFIIDLTNNTCCFYDTKHVPHIQTPIKVSLKEIRDSVQPFTQKCGVMYDKYTHVQEIVTPYLKIYAYLKLIDNLPKGVDGLKLTTYNRNSYLDRKYRILKIEDFATASVFTTKDDAPIKYKKFRKTVQNNNIPAYCVYDCETVSRDGKLKTFMIYAYENFYGSWFSWCSNDNIQLFTEEFDYGSIEFVKWLHNLCLRISTSMNCDNEEFPNYYLFRLFGYNNFSFDNHFLYEALRKIFNLGRLSYKDRYGKTTECSLQVKGLTLSIVDIIRWFPATSLSTACKNFNIKQGKLDIDIVKYCTECSNFKQLIQTCQDISVFIKRENLTETEYEQLVTPYRDENGIYNILKLIGDYCKRDVEATAELYEKLQENISIVIKEFNQIEIFVPFLDLFQYISPPQLAFTILKNLLVKQKQPVIIFRDVEQNQFIYESYMGGRTDYTCIGHVFPHPSPVDNSPGEYLYVDVTSEYPTVMKGMYPDVRSLDSIERGYDIDLTHYQELFDNAYNKRNELFRQKKLHTSFEFLKEINNFKCVLKAHIYPPENCSTWSPVGTRLIQNGGSSKLFFLNHAQENRILNSWHFAALILSGWKIELVECEYNIIFTQQAQLLKDYVDIVGEKKTAAVNNKSLRNLLKLLMNSLYGKLAQKPTHLVHSHISIDNVVMENEKSELIDWSSSYHYISTFITSASSWIIFDAAYKCELEYLYLDWTIEKRVNIVIYCDTDSLIVNKYKKSSFAEFTIDEKLGEWDEEACTFKATWKYETYSAPIRSVIILSKKSYTLLGPNLEILVNKSKGLHTHMAENLTFDVLKSISAGKPLQLSFSGLNKVKQNINKSVLNISQNTPLSDDFIKSICETTLRKTVTRDTISDFDVVVPDDEIDMLVNKDNLLHIGENNYLTYTASSKHKNIWNLIKERTNFNIERSISNSISNATSQSSFEVSLGWASSERSSRPSLSSR